MVGWLLVCYVKTISFFQKINLKLNSLVRLLSFNKLNTDSSSMSKTRTVVIIGGGIAGTSCAEYILENDKVNEVKVIIITPKDVVKTAVTKKELTRTLKEIGILETEADKYEATDARLSVKVGFVIKIDTTGLYFCLL